MSKSANSAAHSVARSRGKKPEQNPRTAAKSSDSGRVREAKRTNPRRSASIPAKKRIKANSSARTRPKIRKVAGTEARVASSISVREGVSHHDIPQTLSIPYSDGSVLREVVLDQPAIRKRYEDAQRVAATTAVKAWLRSPNASSALMNLAHDAIIIRNTKSIIESWNLGAEAVYGYPAAEAVGKVGHILLHTAFPCGRQTVEDVLLHTNYWEGELYHYRKDGRRIIVHSRQSLLRRPNGLPLLIKEINRDITEERRQLGFLRLLKEVGEAVREAQTPPEAIRWALASICVHTQWCFGRAVLLNANGNADANADSSDGGASATEAQLANHSDPDTWFVGDEARFAPVRKALKSHAAKSTDSSLCAKAVRTNQAVWVENLAQHPHFRHIAELAAAGLVSAFAQPISLSSGVAAVLILFTDAPAAIDDPFLGTMASLAAHLRRCFEGLAAQSAMRRLSLSLMRVQDDERRRIARELHDSAGQYLGALGMTLEAMRRAAPSLPPPAEKKLDESLEIINRCSAELRTLSHLLHPPLLEELGLASAITWYIEGFGERSGIAITAQIPQLPRFEGALELTLFRVLQESLTNILRHSGSKTAQVKVEADAGRIMLEVADQGKGIPQGKIRGWSAGTAHSGVGVAGMRERLSDLGGALEINSSPSGTVVRASLPLRAPEQASACGEAAAESAANLLASPLVTREEPRAAAPVGVARESAESGASESDDAAEASAAAAS